MLLRRVRIVCPFDINSADVGVSFTLVGLVSCSFLPLVKLFPMKFHLLLSCVVLSQVVPFMKSWSSSITYSGCREEFLSSSQKESARTLGQSARYIVGHRTTHNSDFKCDLACILLPVLAQISEVLWSHATCQLR